jgi:circadian clock protein KaiC
LTDELRDDAGGSFATSGIANLDEILGGGFQRERLFLIDGDPGTGKTTLSLQFVRDGARLGEHALYFTLSETRQELLAVARSHGWDLAGVEVVELISGGAELDSDAHITMYHPSEVDLTETTRTLLETVDRVRAKRIVVDSLADLRLLSHDPLRYRRQILALKQAFLQRKCTALLLDDRTSHGSDRLLHSIAHGVIVLEQMAPEFGGDRRRMRVVKYRGRAYRGGYHDFAIARGGLRVFPRLQASEHHAEFTAEQVASGIASLDALLGGGPDRGTSTLLLGPAGSGKSTLAMQYAVAAANRGEHGAVFLFDESPVTLKARMEGIGTPYREGSNPGEIEVEQIDPGEISPGEFAYRIRLAVERDGASVIVIDSLNGYLHAMPEERFLIIQLHETLGYLNRKGVTTLMVVAQHGGLAAALDAPVDASYVADAVVLLRYFERGGAIRKAVSVLKKRTGAHEQTVRELLFTPQGIELSGPLADVSVVFSPTALQGRAPARAGAPDPD